MDCCENKNIGCVDYENLCVNCGTIFDYQYVNEISFRDYNMNISNISFYKKIIYKRKNIYIICVCISKRLMTT